MTETTRRVLVALCDLGPGPHTAAAIAREARMHSTRDVIAPLLLLAGVNTVRHGERSPYAGAVAIKRRTEPKLYALTERGAALVAQYAPADPWDDGDEAA